MVTVLIPAFEQDASMLWNRLSWMYSKGDPSLTGRPGCDMAALMGTGAQSVHLHIDGVPVSKFSEVQRSMAFSSSWWP